jgi:hypothetical protein
MIPGQQMPSISLNQCPTAHHTIGVISRFFGTGCNRVVMAAAPTRTALYSRSIKRGSVYIST